MNIFQKWFKKVRQGFTLIELLVAVAIIGILAALIVINISGARAKAVTSKVMEDVNAMARAAEVARATGTLDDNNGYFAVAPSPAGAENAYAGGSCGSQGNLVYWSNETCLLKMKDPAGNSLIKALPQHPMRSEYYYFHSMGISGGHYTVSGKIAEKTTSGAPRFYIATTNHSGVKKNANPLDPNLYPVDNCMEETTGESLCTVSDSEDDTNTNGGNVSN